MTKLKNSNCDKTKKNQIVMKIKLWEKSSSDKTQIVKKKKTQKLKMLQNPNCDETQELKYDRPWNSNCDKTQNLNLKDDKSQFMRRRKNFKRVF